MHTRRSSEDCLGLGLAILLWDLQPGQSLFHDTLAGMLRIIGRHVSSPSQPLVCFSSGRAVASERFRLVGRALAAVARRRPAHHWLPVLPPLLGRASFRWRAPRELPPANDDVAGVRRRHGLRGVHALGRAARRGDGRPRLHLPAVPHPQQLGPRPGRGPLRRRWVGEMHMWPRHRRISGGSSFARRLERRSRWSLSWGRGGWPGLGSVQGAAFSEVLWRADQGAGQVGPKGWSAKI